MDRISYYLLLMSLCALIVFGGFRCVQIRAELLRTEEEISFLCDEASSLKRDIAALNEAIRLKAGEEELRRVAEAELGLVLPQDRVYWISTDY